MQKLTVAELAAETVELLPGRETLVGDLNLVGIVATNTSMAANVLAICSSASSVAAQGIFVNQY
ncbi:hypothetical protein RBS60_02665 [Sinomonas sp. ASV486]|uniref:hypothetical protein n=1 Tax=Sinomonas sp. ASV486 TaxID=3051170 RepID=UPI0027DBDC7B|nr:hypothetical protein [Sinomonas sp. ASV486]MDQ4489099.1 hypothetical protein [Sinomonas sp. ASV486]